MMVAFVVNCDRFVVCQYTTVTCVVELEACLYVIKSPTRNMLKIQIIICLL